MELEPSIDPKTLYVMEPRPLGAGGYAQVMAATRRSDGLEVALKRSKGGRGALDRLAREIRAQRDLAHPNIMPIWDFDPGYQWYTMPRAEGSLTKLRSSLEEDDLETILLGLCDALEVAHIRGHIHRDISPNNILKIPPMGTTQSRWVLSDWGLTSRPPSSTSPPLTATGQGLGTPGFASPEVATNAKEASAPADIYSLGRVAEWFFSRKWPTVGLQNPPEGKYQHWRQFIISCTSPRIEDRPASVTKMRALLEQTLDWKDQPPAARAQALLSGITAGNTGDFDALVNLAVGYPDDAVVYLDNLAVTPSARIRNWTESNPHTASQIAQQMAWHTLNSWEGRDTDYVETPLGFIFTILATLVAVNSLGNAEDVAVQYCSADLAARHTRQRDRTLEWLAELDDPAATLMNRVIAQRPELVEYYRQPRSWRPRSSVLAALLAK